MGCNMEKHKLLFVHSLESCVCLEQIEQFEELSACVNWKSSWTKMAFSMSNSRTIISLEWNRCFEFNCALQKLFCFHNIHAAQCIRYLIAFFRAYSQIPSLYFHDFFFCFLL